ncbi:gephyrin-like molybdotransferase Glp [Ruegeria sp. HKCCD7559]|uniref:molybdopterin-binding protein n=1 Tax=Ruegeria sp. HKCCD7559 TaxID=2683005 RepID=UPI0014928491|nr:gephyrin-like molybdotransferase Glp [Ruegeria sp. HKCCD7559]NOC46267.1 molybdopterin molybdenumtransferase MoeA [Ruegeria sp. HKCCD7559]
MVDWSGGNDTGPTPRKDAIWACIARNGKAFDPEYLRNRRIAEQRLDALIRAELKAGRRLLLGFDFPFGYPCGFARAMTGTDDPLVLWDWFDQQVEDSPKANNRFDLAGRINLQFGGRGPFWMNGLRRDINGLPRTKSDYSNPFPNRRVVETLAKGSFTCWQMAGAGAVGGQVMMGLPILNRLRHRFAGQISVWPFEPLDKPVAFVEIWPSLTLGAAPDGRIKDAWQVEQVALTLSRLTEQELDAQLNVSAAEEGWILGVPQDKPNIAPPPLRNDCFALPAGVNWTPVDEALTCLRDRLHPITASETMALTQACGRVLTGDVVARRSNPPQPNTAVDGYGFAGPAPDGPQIMPLVDGRAAAGIPFDGDVPEGRALRVLTGAALPAGVDTVILEEDVTVKDGHIAFHGPLKKGANTRRAGEDVAAGDIALPAGRRLTPADLALLSAVGIAEVNVRKPLRVAVVSTGDELVEAGENAGPGQIFDANRPMLLSLIDRMGFVPVDMGRVSDDRDALRDRLDQAAEQADVILTSGGASAGDEDHVSALLRQAGAMQHWRIALKPGRPLALGLWSGVPVFGLPGNPVAAMVCTLIFARPALGLMSGEGWAEPQGFEVPAAFEKRKKPGRREYLRARMRDGRAEVFHSEGSGRISGLSWAEGLVEIEDGARHVKPGDMVRFLPYGSFGL